MDLQTNRAERESGWQRVESEEVALVFRTSEYLLHSDHNKGIITSRLVIRDRYSVLGVANLLEYRAVGFRLDIISKNGLWRWNRGRFPDVGNRNGNNLVTAVVLNLSTLIVGIDVIILAVTLFLGRAEEFTGVFIAHPDLNAFVTCISWRCGRPRLSNCRGTH